EVQKFSEGYYTLFEMNAGSGLVAELERRFRNHESVIKFMSIRMDEQVKAAERQKVRYARETKRKAQAGIKERSAEEVMG
ncbi:MAG: 30S ribosomal protein S6, partial [Holophaga sp.]|nr:30S ribosomal protein S6 [Holophaga sp.]